jgi:hypothetical protein
VGRTDANDIADLCKDYTGPTSTPSLSGERTTSRQRGQNVHAARQHAATYERERDHVRNAAGGNHVTTIPRARTRNTNHVRRQDPTLDAVEYQSVQELRGPERGQSIVGAGRHDARRDSLPKRGLAITEVSHEGDGDDDVRHRHQPECKRERDADLSYLTVTHGWELEWESHTYLVRHGQRLAREIQRRDRRGGECYQMHASATLRHPCEKMVTYARGSKQDKSAKRRVTIEMLTKCQRS